MYSIVYDPQAKKDMKFWERSSPQTLKRILGLLHDIAEHPTWGIGNPKTLRTDRTKWAREINKKDRLIYKIHNKEIYVYVFSARGHYDDH